MTRRAIVNVSTGRYFESGRRLSQKMKEMDPQSMQFFWGAIPYNWPKHEDNPYAFKAYSLKDAAKFADLLLWCDAAVIPVRSLEPLWERIERDGYWFAINGWTNYEWTADSAYADLFPGVSIEEARALNKSFTQVVATAFGLNVKHPMGAAFLAEYYRLANTDAFKGPWSNTRNPKHWKQDPSRMGDCGPEDVIGHRHDQTAASLIAYRLGMVLTQCPSIFSFPPGAEDTILMSVGA